MTLAPVVPVECLLFEATELSLRRVRGCRLDGIASEIDGHGLYFPTYSVDPFRRNDHQMIEPPMAGFDDQIADCPGSVLDEHVLHVADVPVGRLNAIPSDGVAASQV